MTDETPEVPEEKAPEEKVAKKATKKKAARKRTAKPKVESEEAASELNETETEAPPEAAPSQAPQGNSAESEAPAPDSEVRRISNKPGEDPVETVRTRKGGKARKVANEEATGDEAQETTAVISEPPASEEGGNKRRRRRRRKGGQGEDGEEQSRAPRPKLDPELVAKKAWRIYLSEVSEEGLALISDQDARELSRRSFRLAEVFLEEAARHQ